MKCVVVLLALAVAVQSSVIPYPYAAWPYAGWPYAPAIGQISHVPAAHVVAAAPAVTVAKHVPAAVQVVAHPAVVAHHPAVVAHAPAVVVAAAPSASYTAATRGAVHQAPLEGHAVSQTSLNLAPAPGTV